MGTFLFGYTDPEEYPNPNPRHSRPSTSSNSYSNQPTGSSINRRRSVPDRYSSQPKRHRRASAPHHLPYNNTSPPSTFQAGPEPSLSSSSAVLKPQTLTESPSTTTATATASPVITHHRLSRKKSVESLADVYKIPPARRSSSPEETKSHKPSLRITTDLPPSPNLPDSAASSTTSPESLSSPESIPSPEQPPSPELPTTTTELPFSPDRPYPVIYPPTNPKGTNSSMSSPTRTKMSTAERDSKFNTSSVDKGPHLPMPGLSGKPNTAVGSGTYEIHQATSSRAPSDPTATSRTPLSWWASSSTSRPRFTSPPESGVMCWWDFIDCSGLGIGGGGGVGGRGTSRGARGISGGIGGVPRTGSNHGSNNTKNNNTKSNSNINNNKPHGVDTHEDASALGFQIRVQVTLVFLRRKIGEEGVEVVLSALTLTLNVVAFWPLVFMWINAKLEEVPIPPLS